MNFISRNLRKIRKSKNLSQTAFGELFGITRASMGAYEEQRAMPPVEVLTKIANHFKISLEAMLSRDLHLNEILHIEHRTALIDNSFRFSSSTKETNLENRITKLESEIKELKTMMVELVAQNKKKE